MPLTLNKIIIASVVFIYSSLNISCSQEKSDSSGQNKKDVEHHHIDEQMQDDQGTHKKNEGEKTTQSIIREGEIDLTAIDGNGDGKVYQDQMCWNVVSDESGECPICGMTLKEVALEDAKKNLEENDFEVK